MKTRITHLMLFLGVLAVNAQKPAYVIYTGKGKEVKYEKMLKSISQQKVVLFGELHNNPIAHWLELELLKDLSLKQDVILGAEMFESHNQKELSAYLKGEIEEEQFLATTNLWSNYNTDYKPLIEYAKANNVKCIATNIPKQYAQLVYQDGFEVLEHLVSEEKQLIAPLPIEFDPELPMYKNILTMAGDHGSPKLVKAQAIRDATMAHFILENYNEEKLFFHLNGAYHSNNYEGILWYLKNRNNQLGYATISTVEQENTAVLLQEHIGLADYIICIPSTMTKTY